VEIVNKFSGQCPLHVERMTRIDPKVRLLHLDAYWYFLGRHAEQRRVYCSREVCGKRRYTRPSWISVMVSYGRTRHRLTLTAARDGPLHVSTVAALDRIWRPRWRRPCLAALLQQRSSAPSLLISAGFRQIGLCPSQSFREQDSERTVCYHRAPKVIWSVTHICSRQPH
jgi:hypothetical protein